MHNEGASAQVVQRAASGSEEEIEEIICQPGPRTEAETCGDEAQQDDIPSTSTSGGAAVEQDEDDLLKRADQLKQTGNRLYTEEQYEAAAEQYWQALDICPEGAQQRAIYYANLAACYLKREEWQQAVEQCTNALRIDEAYMKALVRRATALEHMDDLEHAVADAKKVLDTDPENAWALKTLQRLEPVVKERQEKMKEEMMGKLKGLGNTLLGKFGLSLDNFKAEKDPDTGSYSIKFQQ